MVCGVMRAGESYDGAILGKHQHRKQKAGVESYLWLQWDAA